MMADNNSPKIQQDDPNFHKYKPKIDEMFAHIFDIDTDSTTETNDVDIASENTQDSPDGFQEDNTLGGNNLSHLIDIDKVREDTNYDSVALADEDYRKAQNQESTIRADEENERLERAKLEQEIRFEEENEQGKKALAELNGSDELTEDNEYGELFDLLDENDELLQDKSKKKKDKQKNKKTKPLTSYNQPIDQSVPPFQPTGTSQPEHVSQYTPLTTNDSITGSNFHNSYENDSGLNKPSINSPNSNISQDILDQYTIPEKNNHSIGLSTKETVIGQSSDYDFNNYNEQYDTGTDERYSEITQNAREEFTKNLSKETGSVKHKDADTFIDSQERKYVSYTDVQTDRDFHDVINIEGKKDFSASAFETDLNNRLNSISNPNSEFSTHANVEETSTAIHVEVSKGDVSYSVSIDKANGEISGDSKALETIVDKLYSNEYNRANLYSIGDDNSPSSNYQTFEYEKWDNNHFKELLNCRDSSTPILCTNIDNPNKYTITVNNELYSFTRNSETNEVKFDGDYTSVPEQNRSAINNILATATQYQYNIQYNNIAYADLNEVSKNKRQEYTPISGPLTGTQKENTIGSRPIANGSFIFNEELYNPLKNLHNEPVAEKPEITDTLNGIKNTSVSTKPINPYRTEDVSNHYFASDLIAKQVYNEEKHLQGKTPIKAPKGNIDNSFIANAHAMRPDTLYTYQSDGKSQYRPLNTDTFKNVYGSTTQNVNKAPNRSAGGGSPPNGPRNDPFGFATPMNQQYLMPQFKIIGHQRAIDIAKQTGHTAMRHLMEVAESNPIGQGVRFTESNFVLPIAMFASTSYKTLYNVAHTNLAESHLSNMDITKQYLKKLNDIGIKTKGKPISLAQMDHYNRAISKTVKNLGYNTSQFSTQDFRNEINRLKSIIKKNPKVSNVKEIKYKINVLQTQLMGTNFGTNFHQINRLDSIYYGKLGIDFKELGIHSLSNKKDMLLFHNAIRDRFKKYDIKDIYSLSKHQQANLLAKLHKDKHVDIKDIKLLESIMSKKNVALDKSFGKIQGKSRRVQKFIQFLQRNMGDADTIAGTLFVMRAQNMVRQIIRLTRKNAQLLVKIGRKLGWDRAIAAKLTKTAMMSKRAEEIKAINNYLMYGSKSEVKKIASQKLSTAIGKRSTLNKARQKITQSTTMKATQKIFAEVSKKFASIAAKFAQFATKAKAFFNHIGLGILAGVGIFTVVLIQLMFVCSMFSYAMSPIATFTNNNYFEKNVADVVEDLIYADAQFKSLVDSKIDAKPAINPTMFDGSTFDNTGFIDPYNYKKEDNLCKLEFWGYGNFAPEKNSKVNVSGPDFYNNLYEAHENGYQVHVYDRPKYKMINPAKYLESGPAYNVSYENDDNAKEITFKSNAKELLATADSVIGGRVITNIKINNNGVEEDAGKTAGNSYILRALTHKGVKTQNGTSLSLWSATHGYQLSTSKAYPCNGCANITEYCNSEEWKDLSSLDNFKYNLADIPTYNKRGCYEHVPSPNPPKDYYSHQELTTAQSINRTGWSDLVFFNYPLGAITANNETYAVDSKIQKLTYRRTVRPKKLNDFTKAQTECNHFHYETVPNATHNETVEFTTNSIGANKLVYGDFNGAVQKFETSAQKLVDDYISFTTSKSHYSYVEMQPKDYPGLPQTTFILSIFTEKDSLHTKYFYANQLNSLQPETYFNTIFNNRNGFTYVQRCNGTYGRTFTNPINNKKMIEQAFAITYLGNVENNDYDFSSCIPATSNAYIVSSSSSVGIQTPQKASENKITITLDGIDFGSFYIYANHANVTHQITIKAPSHKAICDGECDGHNVRYCKGHRDVCLNAYIVSSLNPERIETNSKKARYTVNTLPTDTVFYADALYGPTSCMSLYEPNPQFSLNENQPGFIKRSDLLDFHGDRYLWTYKSFHSSNVSHQEASDELRAGAYNRRQLSWLEHYDMYLFDRTYHKIRGGLTGRWSNVSNFITFNTGLEAYDAVVMENHFDLPKQSTPAASAFAKYAFSTVGEVPYNTFGNSYGSTLIPHVKQFTFKEPHIGQPNKRNPYDAFNSPSIHKDEPYYTIDTYPYTANLYRYYKPYITSISDQNQFGKPMDQFPTDYKSNEEVKSDSFGRRLKGLNSEAWFYWVLKSVTQENSNLVTDYPAPRAPIIANQIKDIPKIPYSNLKNLLSKGAKRGDVLYNPSNGKIGILLGYGCPDKDIPTMTSDPINGSKEEKVEKPASTIYKKNNHTFDITYFYVIEMDDNPFVSNVVVNRYPVPGFNEDLGNLFDTPDLYFGHYRDDVPLTENHWKDAKSDKYYLIKVFPDA